MFQPSPLASKQKLDSYNGEDPLNPHLKLDTPRAMADIQLHFNAVAMRAMLQPECSYALLLVDLLDDRFNMLGEQVSNYLCRTGINMPDGHRLYQPQDLTLSLVGIHASIIWELNRTLKASRLGRSNLGRPSAVMHNIQVNQTTALAAAPSTSSSSVSRSNTCSTCLRPNYHSRVSGLIQHRGSRNAAADGS